MTVAEVVDFIDGYASMIDAPIERQTLVTSVRENGGQGGYRVNTNRGEWQSRCVVLANGACNVASVPKISADLPQQVASVTAMDYRSPTQLPDGEVLVVGASATGVQLADEIHRSGRPVTLAVGEHVRMPRVYRGKDILYWMSRAGILDEDLNDVDDLVRARNISSPQLVGTARRDTLDLNTLTGMGVELVGRLVGVRDGRAQFSGSLKNQCALADLKMNRLLNGIDEWIEQQDVSAEAVHRFADTQIPDKPNLILDFKCNENDRGIGTVVWATGYRPDYSWLDVPVLDRK